MASQSSKSNKPTLSDLGLASTSHSPSLRPQMEEGDNGKEEAQKDPEEGKEGRAGSPRVTLRHVQTELDIERSRLTRSHLRRKQALDNRGIFNPAVNQRRAENMLLCALTTINMTSIDKRAKERLKSGAKKEKKDQRAAKPDSKPRKAATVTQSPVLGRSKKAEGNKALQIARELEELHSSATKAPVGNHLSPSPIPRGTHHPHAPRHGSQTSDSLRPLRTELSPEPILGPGAELLPATPSPPLPLPPPGKTRESFAHSLQVSVTNQSDNGRSRDSISVGASQPTEGREQVGERGGRGGSQTAPSPAVQEQEIPLPKMGPQGYFTQKQKLKYEEAVLTNELIKILDPSKGPKVEYTISELMQRSLEHRSYPAPAILTDHLHKKKLEKRAIQQYTQAGGSGSGRLKEHDSDSMTLKPAKHEIHKKEKDTVAMTKKQALQTPKISAYITGETVFASTQSMAGKGMRIAEPPEQPPTGLTDPPDLKPKRKAEEEEEETEEEKAQARREATIRKLEMKDRTARGATIAQMAARCGNAIDLQAHKDSVHPSHWWMQLDRLPTEDAIQNEAVWKTQDPDAISLPSEGDSEGEEEINSNSKGTDPTADPDDTKETADRRFTSIRLLEDTITFMTKEFAAQKEGRSKRANDLALMKNILIQTLKALLPSLKTPSTVEYVQQTQQQKHQAALANVGQINVPAQANRPLRMPDGDTEGSFSTAASGMGEKEDEMTIKYSRDAFAMRLMRSWTKGVEVLLSWELPLKVPYDGGRTEDLIQLACFYCKLYRQTQRRTDLLVARWKRRSKHVELQESLHAGSMGGNPTDQSEMSFSDPVDPSNPMLEGIESGIENATHESELDSALVDRSTLSEGGEGVTEDLVKTRAKKRKMLLQELQGSLAKAGRNSETGGLVEDFLMRFGNFLKDPKVRSGAGIEKFRRVVFEKIGVMRTLTSAQRNATLKSILERIQSERRGPGDGKEGDALSSNPASSLAGVGGSTNVFSSILSTRTAMMESTEERVERQKVLVATSTLQVLNRYLQMAPADFQFAFRNTVQEVKRAIAEGDLSIRDDVAGHETGEVESSEQKEWEQIARRMEETLLQVERDQLTRKYIKANEHSEDLEELLQNPDLWASKLKKKRGKKAAQKPAEPVVDGEAAKKYKWMQDRQKQREANFESDPHLAPREVVQVGGPAPTPVMEVQEEVGLAPGALPKGPSGAPSLDTPLGQPPEGVELGLPDSSQTHTQGLSRDTLEELKLKRLEELDSVWASLKMEYAAKVALYDKYDAKPLPETQRALEVWQAASRNVFQREHSLTAIQAFETVTADPNRHKNPDGTADREARMKEEKKRARLFRSFCQAGEQAEVSARRLQIEFDDVLHFHKDPYIVKIKNDYQRVLMMLENRMMRDMAVAASEAQREGGGMSPIPIPTEDPSGGGFGGIDGASSLSPSILSGTENRSGEG